MMRTRSSPPLRVLDNLPPELLSQVLSLLKPQEMLVFSTSSRRWCGTDYDNLYWKPAFLNAFALDPRGPGYTKRHPKGKELWLREPRACAVVTLAEQHGRNPCP